MPASGSDKWMREPIFGAFLSSSVPAAIDAFALYRHVIRSETLPPTLRTALAELRNVAKVKGYIDAASLNDVHGRAAAGMARLALERQVQPAIDLAAISAYTSPQPRVSARQLAAARLDASSLTPEWATAMAAELCAADAHHEAERVRARRPGYPWTDPQHAQVTAAVYHHHALLETAPRAPSGHLMPETMYAIADVHDNLMGSLVAVDATPAATAAAARRQGMRALYAKAANAKPLPNGEPVKLRATLGRLAASNALAVRATPPAHYRNHDYRLLRRVFEHFISTGFASTRTFEDVYFAVHTHALPSLAALVSYLNRCGAFFIAFRGKGYSSSAEAGMAIANHAYRCDLGVGDCFATAAEHDADIEYFWQRSIDEAAKAGTSLIALGDGRVGARAFKNVARATPGERPTYVEFTRSGLRELRAGGDPGFAVHDFAEWPAKLAVDTCVIGAHTVAQVAPPAGSTSAVVGYGTVGSGVAAALRERDVRVIVHETTPSGIEAARRDGFDVHESGGLAAADYYFSCTGEPGTLGREHLAAMPAGATVVNVGSRGDICVDTLVRAHRGEDPSWRLTLESPRDVVDRAVGVLHRENGAIRLLHMGQPVFAHVEDGGDEDAVDDRSLALADFYMAGLFINLVCAARECRQAGTGDTTRAEMNDLLQCFTREVYPDLMA